ncbi:MAG: Asp-tRNA(Asn)/Glu-tRNA(Gln) amidotransferase subunit GatB [Cyclobacteriaceae bacterium]|nr:Asp-tRNA(Asn)/Glu-tRNA(Gln) amidotransferase subunit GatB [Cyclobacteriaceae bacterium]UYN88541.1 MAG: Asp-tRNA(Asn)/Glu-tRNA(Gln) amidotransferase subunit GatB [Cyclobacteriaceae bacterium]
MTAFVISTIEKYTAVIGLEVHAQLLTTSKIFASDYTTYGSAPNTNISAITLAHPGTLPRLNRKVVELAVRMGLACHSQITQFMIFDRKNYFYPDLPKGYQLTQDRTPICKGGYVKIRINGEERNIQLNRIHLEEDAGKSMHIEGTEDTYVDFNRAGVPLIEIVTDPVLRSSAEAYAFLTEVRKLVRYLDVCDGNMEEGSLRCDANVSVMLKNATAFGKKVEIKNMNSIRHVQRAIDSEIARQISALEAGTPVISETRLFNADTGATYSMRAKEELNDYRYFPDPDLSPVAISENWLSEIKASMPALPDELVRKFTTEYKLPLYDAEVLTDTKEVAQYFEEVCRHVSNYKAVSNWIMGPVKSALNDLSLAVNEFPVTAVTLAELIQLVESGKLSFSVASQRVLPELLKNVGNSPLEVAQQLNVLQSSDQDSILPVIEGVVADFPDKVQEYKRGKKGILAMFMGEVIKRSKGKADPKVANQLLLKKLEEK